MTLLDELVEAADSGDAQRVARLLKDSGASFYVNVAQPGKLRRTALHMAARRGHVAVLSLLIEHGAQVDIQDDGGYTALFCAARHGHRDAVQLLIKEGADANLRSKAGTAPVYAACLSGDVDTLRLLLEAGADCEIGRPDDGRTAAHVAAQFGHVPVLRELLHSADPNVLDSQGRSPVYTAALFGHADAVHVLIGAGADPDVRAEDGSSPLHAAAARGHVRAVRSLLDGGALCDSRNSAQLSPADVAGCFGHADVLQLLLRHSPMQQFRLLPPNAEALVKIRLLLRPAAVSGHKSTSVSVPHDEQLINSELRDALCSSGFVQSRAIQVSAMSDVMESITRRRVSERVHLVGSYSDGWTTSLARLDGGIDYDSDIDATELLPQRPFHLRGFCKCESTEPEEQLEYRNGHVVCPGLASHPSDSDMGSALRPARDWVSSYCCCNYPSMQLFEGCYGGHIPPRVMTSLRKKLSSSPCHLVTATPPGQGGKQLRVSTSLLERALLRSLSTEQGQLYVVLKYLVKRVISVRARGLKSYHAKTLVMYMLDELEPGLWHTEGLLGLSRKALQKLLRALQAEPDTNWCMCHFFLRDAHLYLRKDHCEKREIAPVVSDVIDQLPQLLLQMRNSLRPLRPGGDFNFHPFLIIPIMEHVSGKASESGSLEYHEVYDVVVELLVKLAHDVKEFDSLQPLLDAASRLPDYARAASLSLTALAYLKFGMREAAAQVLRPARSHRTSRGVPPCPGDSPTAADAVSHVRRHLEDSDSAWKFSFRVLRRPAMTFLGNMSFAFPCKNLHINWHYMNFKALLRCLCLELLHLDEAEQRRWFEETLKSEDTDAQELLVALQFCRDRELLVCLIHKHRRVIGDHDEAWRKVRKMLKADNEMLEADNEMLEADNEMLEADSLLAQLSTERTLATALDDLRCGYLQRQLPAETHDSASGFSAADG